MDLGYEPHKFWQAPANNNRFCFAQGQSWVLFVHDEAEGEIPTVWWQNVRLVRTCIIFL